MGEIQAVYVNGHLIANNIKRFDDVKEFKLDQAIIYKGKNIYAIVGIPQKPRYQWDDLNADPGIIKVSEPAGKWKRKLFNGLAQVIVQSSKQAGEITLTATSENLKSESVKIFSKAVVLRPAVK